MKKIVFLDVDGTLLPEGAGRVPDSTLKALGLLRENDIGVALSTGRHMVELQDLGVAEIPFDGYVLMNGQLVLDGNFNRIYSNPIKGKDKEELLELFYGTEIPVMLLEEDRVYMNFMNDDFMAAQTDINSGILPVEEYRGADILMGVIYTDKDIKFSNLVTGRWNRKAADVYPPLGGKVNGIKELLRTYGLSREDTVAFGDSQNDIEMLEFAGTGVAMGNSWPEALAAADMVTDDCRSDGIMNGLKRLGLI